MCLTGPSKMLQECPSLQSAYTHVKLSKHASVSCSGAVKSSAFRTSSSVVPTGEVCKSIQISRCSCLLLYIYRQTSANFAVMPYIRHFLYKASSSNEVAQVRQVSDSKPHRPTMVHARNSLWRCRSSRICCAATSQKGSADTTKVAVLGIGLMGRWVLCTQGCTPLQTLSSYLAQS